MRLSATASTEQAGNTQRQAWCTWVWIEAGTAMVVQLGPSGDIDAGASSAIGDHRKFHCPLSDAVREETGCLHFSRHGPSAELVSGRPAGGALPSSAAATVGKENSGTCGGSLLIAWAQSVRASGQLRLRG